MNTVFLRVLEAEDKATALLETIREPIAARSGQKFETDTASFAVVPGSPFAYWVSERLRRLFKELPPFEAEGRTAKVGPQTSDDFRFVRTWWAVSQASMQTRWYPFVRGGSHSPFYSDVSFLVGYSRGDQVGLMAIGRYGRGADCYFRPGLTWPLRGSRFSAQAIPAGCIFSVAGKMAFVPDDQPAAWLALFNSECFDKFIAFFAGSVGGVQYEAGLIQRVLVPSLGAADKSKLAALARRAWSLKRMFTPDCLR